MPERSMEKQSFPLSLALVDALPVLFFGAAAAILGVKLKSAVFIVAGGLVILIGLQMWGVPLLRKLRAKGKERRARRTAERAAKKALKEQTKAEKLAAKAVPKPEAPAPEEEHKAE